MLPQYSGGLGILAGDHLKAASDLGVPIVGVGLLYKHGYFKQSLSREGWQQETYPVLDPDGLPISMLREDNGARATISIAMPDGPEMLAQIWVASVGRVPLLMLDTDVEGNPDPYRDVTDRLYGGNSEHRLRQELLLGVGGVRALRVFSRITGHAAPEVFHTNEGHAGFLGLERIRELTVAEDGPKLDFDTALEVGRASTVFTTHTPVPAGIDRFPRTLVEQYFSEAGATPGVPIERILPLGTEDYVGGDPSVFNMAVMGFRLAQRANGVSQLHGHVSREMFQGLWPAFDEAEVPIGSITNGVHAPTWVAREVIALAAREGADPDSDDTEAFWAAVDKIPSADIWSTKRELRERLVVDARKRLAKSCEKRGMAKAELGWIETALDPDVLTIGFARRAASYKRLTLMLRDPERLKRLLLHPERPIQLIMAGKAHPADDGGKKLIQAIVQLADDPELRHRIAYLPNYDIAMAQPLYPGCDVWLNNPLRPYEACGTSGMKAALNGGLNLSILDGWWDEWYDGENGWAIPSADGVVDPDHRDDLEATALYDLIENEVAPRFYDVDAEGVPTRWLEMTRHTLKSLGPKVLATRMVSDYVRQLYTPAATTARELNSDYAGAVTLAAWKKKVQGRLAERAGRARREQRRQRRPGGRRRDERARLRRPRRPHSRRRRGAADPRPQQRRGRADRHHGRVAARRRVLRGRPAPLRRRPGPRPVRRLRLHGPGHPAQRPARLTRRARHRRPALTGRVASPRRCPRPSTRPVRPRGGRRPYVGRGRAGRRPGPSCRRGAGSPWRARPRRSAPSRSRAARSRRAASRR